MPWFSWRRPIQAFHWINSPKRKRIVLAAIRTQLRAKEPPPAPTDASPAERILRLTGVDVRQSVTSHRGDAIGLSLPRHPHWLCLDYRPSAPFGDSKEPAEFPFKLHSVTHIGAVQVQRRYIRRPAVPLKVLFPMPPPTG